MKSIYQYADYRLYLRDFYQFKKREKRSYSYAHLAKQAKSGSPNYPKLVIDGKRNLTINNIHHFAKAIEFNFEETEYFEALVLKNQASDAQEQKFYHRRLIKLKNHFKVVSPSTFSRTKSMPLLDDTKRNACLLLASKKMFEKAIQAISIELKIDPSASKRILESLIEDGSLVKKADRLTLPFKNTMVNDPKGINEKQRRFLSEGLLEAVGIFSERYPALPAKFLSLVLTARSGALSELFDQLRVAAERVTVEHEPDGEDSEGVYRLQLQVYRINHALE